MISTPSPKDMRHGEPAAEATGGKGRRARSVPPIGRKAARSGSGRAGTTARPGAGYFRGVPSTARSRPTSSSISSTGASEAPVPKIAGFNIGETRSLRMPRRRLPANAAAGEARDPRTLWRPRRRMASNSIRQGDPRETILATPRDALYGWTSERLRDQADRAWPARLPLPLRPWSSGGERRHGLHDRHAAEIPVVFGTATDTPPYWPEDPRQRRRTPLRRRDGRLRCASSPEPAGPRRRGVKAVWRLCGTDRRLHGLCRCARERGRG